MGLLWIIIAGLVTAFGIARFARRIRSREDFTPRQTRTMFLIVGASLALPALAMLNCGGWNEGSGKVASCAIDTPFLREISEFFYNWLLLSAFTLGLPILVYLLLVLVAAKFVARRVS